MSMQKLNLSLLGLAFCTNTAVAAENYQIESGIVEYEGTSESNFLGKKFTNKVKKVLYFKDYGNTILTKETTTTQDPVSGKKEVETTITKIEGDDIYSVDEEDKTIFKKSLSPKEKEMGQKIANKIKTEKLGTRNILGYTCEIQSVSEFNSRACVYKGVTLQSDLIVMGSKINETATNIQFNVDVSADQLKLPDYPITDAQSMMDEAMEGASEEEKAAMQKFNNMSEEEILEAMKLMQGGLK